MSYQDFCRCTPYEFASIIAAWRDLEKQRDVADLERMRWMGYIVSLPYVDKKERKGFKPQDLLLFSWEKDSGNRTEEKPMSDEEKKARFVRALEARGLRLASDNTPGASGT